MWAAGGLSRQVPADAAASQLCEASAPTLPLFPGNGAQPPPEPLVKIAQHRGRLAEAEVAAPSTLTICARLRPRVRRVSSRTLALKRVSACGAIRRRGSPRS
jgi:hypothetical protein